MGEKGLKELSKQGLLCGDNIGDMKLCELCTLGKAKKHSYGTSKHISKVALDYAHADLWGPAKTATRNGGKYFLSIIDDYSRKLRVMYSSLRTRHEKFKEQVIEMENQYGKVLKYIITDNGLEFPSTEFNNFCKSKGIIRHRSVPGNPHQNGIVERMNRTSLERIRCMINGLGLAKNFWGSCDHSCSFDQHVSFCSPKFQVTRGNMERGGTRLLLLKEFWMSGLCTYKAR